MNKGLFALLMFAVLLLPMYAGLRRIRNLPRKSERSETSESEDGERVGRARLPT